ncbi:MAG: hypothetical protein FJ276_07050 [Planctomycetes bacterium]|nr:hypothetical protein [Planctomycetota bacterium]
MRNPLLIAVLLGAFTGSVLAQTSPDRLFQRLDQDGDGKITRQDLPRYFDQLDQNKDGVITPDELRNADISKLRQRSTAGENTARTTGAARTAASDAWLQPFLSKPGIDHVLVVGDLEKSIKFYADGIGMKPIGDPKKLADGAMVQELQCGTTVLRLRQPEKPPTDGPLLFDGTPGDATNDAAGETQLFEQLFIKGITDVAVPAQGMAWIDLNRDGKLDLLTLQREPKLFLNQGNFEFQEHPLHFEGEITGSQAPTFVDFNGDGLLDLVYPADPGNSWGGSFDGSRPPEALFESKIYLNTGNHGAKQNHWLHLTFTGLKDAELIGARVELTASGWELDHATGSRFGRLGILKSVTFTTDGAGRKLNKPVPVLFCGTGEWRFQNPDSITILSRDDAKGRWVETAISRDIWNPDKSNDTQEIRLVFDHVDRVTGVHYVFAGTTAGSLFHGVYDPAQPGLVRWEPKPDIDDCYGRFLGAAEANGVIYTCRAIDSRKVTQAAQNGAPIEKRCGIYRGVDGSNGRWEWVRVKEWFGEGGGDVSRVGYLCGLTATPDPKNASRQVLLCAVHDRGVARIEQLDPQQGHRATVYSSVSEQLDLGIGQRVPVSRMAYNDMTAATDPASGRPVHLVSGWFKPAGREETGELGKSAWYLVVDADGRAQLGRVFDPAHPLTDSEFGLRCTRSIRPSPFPEEAGRVWYFCGFDQTPVSGRGTAAKGDTAWIYKGTLRASP